MAPDANATPSVRSARHDPLPVPYGKYTLVPAVIDVPGRDPGDISNLLRAAPRLSKRILVVVLAPTASNRATAQTFDSGYIAEQKGYANLPRAVLQKDPETLDRVRRSERVDAVAMFATKFDLVSPVAANDSAAGEARDAVTRAFAQHRTMVEEACRARGVKFMWFVGSSKYGWGIDELRRFITAVID